MEYVWVLIVTLKGTNEFQYCTVYETQQAAKEHVALENKERWSYSIRKKGIWG